MTEDEWECCTDPDSMLRSMRGRASDRKRRLFACGCCRRVVRLSGDDHLLLAIESSERYADGHSTAGELLRAWQAAEAAVWVFNGVVSEQLVLAAIEAITRSHRFRECPQICQRAMEAYEHETAWLPWERRSSIWWADLRAKSARTIAEEQQSQADLLRCVIGNPFRPMTANPRWPGLVTSLARSIYEERAFDRLPVMADALEDAGCDDMELLTHCRRAGQHVLGCWAIDLVLGRV